MQRLMIIVPPSLPSQGPKSEYKELQVIAVDSSWICSDKLLQIPYQVNMNIVLLQLALVKFATLRIFMLLYMFFHGMHLLITGYSEGRWFSREAQFFSWMFPHCGKKRRENKTKRENASAIPPGLQSLLLNKAQSFLKSIFLPPSML